MQSYYFFLRHQNFSFFFFFGYHYHNERYKKSILSKFFMKNLELSEKISTFANGVIN